MFCRTSIEDHPPIFLRILNFFEIFCGLGMGLQGRLLHERGICIKWSLLYSDFGFVCRPCRQESVHRNAQESRRPERTAVAAIQPRTLMRILHALR